MLIFKPTLLVATVFASLVLANGSMNAVEAAGREVIGKEVAYGCIMAPGAPILLPWMESFGGQERWTRFDKELFAKILEKYNPVEHPEVMVRLLVWTYGIPVEIAKEVVEIFVERENLKKSIVTL